MTAKTEPVVATFVGASGNRLICDVSGGQTRHAWRRTARTVAALGFTAYAVDQRGHGDSEWVDDGAYDFPAFADDALALADALSERHGGRPVAVGASLGGMAAMLAQGGVGTAPAVPAFSALVLVDITPRVDLDGVSRVHGFMREHAREGFASVAEAAEAVARYLPHRPRPRSNEGLKKNLRLHPDGRWRWHWDPRFLDGKRRIGPHGGEVETLLVEAARRIAVPTLLVRGASSELVKEEHARGLLELVPHARYVDVGGARHMVAGDRNDQFAAAITTFLKELEQAENVSA